MSSSVSERSPDGIPIYDIHCHLHEINSDRLEEILESDRGLRIVAVSDDHESTLRSLELETLYPDRIVACAGLHPWSIGEEPLHRLESIIRIAERWGVRCVGEVGLDARFIPRHTWGLQVRILTRFLELARELNAFINIHAPDAWSDVLGLLIEHEVERAVFHWYTGPSELIEIIGGRGYMISLNPALRIQEKHLKIASLTPLEYIVFESDAPYNYRGLTLSPLMVRETMELVARVKQVPVDYLVEKARWNSEKLIGRIT